MIERSDAMSRAVEASRRRAPPCDRHTSITRRHRHESSTMPHVHAASVQSNERGVGMGVLVC